MSNVTLHVAAWGSKEIIDAIILIFTNYTCQGLRGQARGKEKVWKIAGEQRFSPLAMPSPTYAHSSPATRMAPRWITEIVGTFIVCSFP